MPRYILQPSKKENHFICTDTENKIICVFENKKFNSTRKMTMLEDFNPDNFMKFARYMREMGDWLMQHHKEKL